MIIETQSHFDDKETLLTPSFSKSRQETFATGASRPMTQQTNTTLSAPPFSANVQTLIDLVHNLPKGIDRAHGANIIRATIQSMGQATGPTVENILSEAQNDQSQILGAIQKNLQKIDDCQATISHLENDIHTKQEQASLLFDLIDLFVMPSEKA